MKTTTNSIELKVWQLLAIATLAISCLISLQSLLSHYQTISCDTTYTEILSETEIDFHRRYIRNVDQCDDIPPMCIVTTTSTSTSTSTTVSTTVRSTVSTVAVTRPTLTTVSTTQRTTTADPWVNRTRPYDSWRLPIFAKPLDYKLRVACLDCFTLVSENVSAIIFNGQVIIHIDISNQTDYLVLHAKNLNIIQAKLTNTSFDPANITYLSDDDMIYLSFAPATIPKGEIDLVIDYTGVINQQDQTGFYRELFWKSAGQIS